MAFLRDIANNLRSKADGFLNGRPSIAPRTSYYANDEDAMAYNQTQSATEQAYQNAPVQPVYRPSADPHYQDQAYSPHRRTEYRTQAGMQDRRFGTDSYTHADPYAQAAENTAYFPNPAFQDANGERFSHIERMSHMTSPEDIHAIISFMMNGESVIVNCESIAGAQEAQRCIDLIAGAACALKCQITQLSLSSKVMLISPPAICVLLDEAFSRINGRHPDGTPLRARGQGGFRHAFKQNTAYHSGNRGGEYKEYEPHMRGGSAYREPPGMRRNETYAQQPDYANDDNTPDSAYYTRAYRDIQNGLNPENDFHASHTEEQSRPAYFSEAL
jgi:FtsZ-interacting cell division protein YlmF